MSNAEDAMLVKKGIHLSLEGHIKICATCASADALSPGLPQPQFIIKTNYK